jgi:hypothetical protein
MMANDGGRIITRNAGRSPNSRVWVDDVVVERV